MGDELGIVDVGNLKDGMYVGTSDSVGGKLGVGAGGAVESGGGVSAFLGGALHGGIDHVDAGKLENADEENEHEGENEGGLRDLGGGAVVPDVADSGVFHH